jgi:hypothetical protein
MSGLRRSLHYDRGIFVTMAHLGVIRATPQRKNQFYTGSEVPHFETRDGKSALKPHLAGTESVSAQPRHLYRLLAFLYAEIL